jgi:hypothetical protein
LTVEGREAGEMDDAEEVLMSVFWEPELTRVVWEPELEVESDDWVEGKG